MTLRGRLVATLLALAAVGMLVLGTVVYASQRGYLYQRVDDQARNAQSVLGAKINGRGFPAGGGGSPGGRFRPADDDDGHRPSPPDVGLPSGTYAVALSASGTPTGTPYVTQYGEVVAATSDTNQPHLPAGLHDDQVLDVKAVGNDDLRYRVRVAGNRLGGGLLAVAVPLKEADDTLHRLLLVEGLVIAGVLLVLGLLSWLLVRAELRPLERISTTADAIAGGELEHRVDVASPRTEVGRLGLAFNAMLARLETAFAKQRASEDRLRAFLADASHELRTPLASIRGYAELFRIGAARDPEEVERSMKRIEDESMRMGVLVEDLLTLARLDEVRAKIAEPVDVAALADDAVADARAMAPDRDVTVTGDEDVLVLGDPDQLRQVLANLVRNALIHTPPGTPVEVGARQMSDGAVELTVRDHGPGLPTADPSTLFGRFWRAEGGRERGKAGAGLGLAIVDGIVRAHGGTVSAANAPEGGAVFTVLLPAPCDPDHRYGEVP